MPPNKDRTTLPLSTGLIVELVHDEHDLIADGPAVTMYVVTTQGRALFAFTMQPDEAQSVAAAIVAGAMAVSK